MNIDNTFIITGTKKLIFRKEGSNYITFNPIDLEFFKINLIGAEILFLVSKKYKIDEIANWFCKKYNISYDLIYNDIITFFSNFGCTNVIKNNLIELNIPIIE